MENFSKKEGQKSLSKLSLDKNDEMLNRVEAQIIEQEKDVEKDMGEDAFSEMIKQTADEVRPEENFLSIVPQFEFGENNKNLIKEEALILARRYIEDVSNPDIDGFLSELEKANISETEAQAIYINELEKAIKEKESIEDKKTDARINAERKLEEKIEDHEVNLENINVVNSEKNGKFEKVTGFFKKNKDRTIEALTQPFENIPNILSALDKQGEKIKNEFREKSQWTRERVEKTADWYKKRSTWEKVLFSAGCIAAASASAAIGGTVGMSIATAAFAGKLGQRMLGGMATFVTAEALLKKQAEKGGREREKSEATRHTIEAALFGVLIGSGAAAQATKELFGFIGDSYREWFPKNEAVNFNSDYSGAENHPKSIGDMEEAKIEIEKKGISNLFLDEDKGILLDERNLRTQYESVSASKENYIETVGSKDSIWKMAERQLESHYGNKFSGLNEAQKTYLIDAIKDKFVENPAKFGLENPEQVAVGQKIDFSNIFENESELEMAFEKASGLSDSEIKNITRNNEKLAEWVKQHSGERLTTQKTMEILSGESSVNLADQVAGTFDNGKDRVAGIIGNVGEQVAGTIGEDQVAGDHIGVNDQVAGAIGGEVIDIDRVKMSEGVNKWLGQIKLDSKSAWLQEALKDKKMTVDNILARDFVNKHLPWEGQITSGDGVAWWELNEKENFQKNIEKLLRDIPMEQRAQFKNMSVADFLEKQINAPKIGSFGALNQVDKLIFDENKIIGMDVQAKVDSFIKMINSKIFSAEDFAEYYEKRTGKFISDESVAALKENFRLINEGDEQQKQMARRAFEVIFRKMNPELAKGTARLFE